ncbi:MAG: Trm112 family protein [Chloroflexi bacterium]|nr:MAG: Trm112 family protein [Chloroflexota bacterium]
MVTTMPGVISDELMEVLACPKCHGKLELVEEGEGGHLDCHNCRLRYRIDDGIPVMLIDEAEKF